MSSLYYCIYFILLFLSVCNFSNRITLPMQAYSTISFRGKTWLFSTETVVYSNMTEQNVTLSGWNLIGMAAEMSVKIK